MKCLSIRQPWAHLIIHGGKNIENRTWTTKYRGRFLVHASKGMTRKEYDEAFRYAVAIDSRFYRDFPAFEDLDRGGVIGSVELTGVVLLHERQSPWHMADCIGFQLVNPKPIPFIPLKGRLGFFGDYDILKVGAYCHLIDEEGEVVDE